MDDPERPPWYVTLFGDAWLEHAIAIPPERTALDIEFITSVLDLPSGARILDLACGHGRHALALARPGYRVTGVDLNEPSLAIAQEEAERASLVVELIHSDMRELHVGNDFDAAINMFTAFGYFEDEEDDERVLRAVAEALRPGGAFLIDTGNQPALMAGYAARDWEELEGGTIWLDQRRFDARTGRNEVRHLVIRSDGRREEFSHSVRLYTFPELSKLLGRAGLDVEQAWGDFEGSDYSMGSPRMIVLARRT